MTHDLNGRRQFLALAGAGLLMGFARTANAHRAKAALTLVTWNKAAGLLEIDHALHAHDAEVALSRTGGVGAPDLSRLEDQARLALYVEARFALTLPDGLTLPLKILGAELLGDNIHVYQEVPLTALPARLLVRNMILRDIFPTQINQVNVDTGRGPDRIRTLTFLGNDGEKDVAL
ncbi:hypothetical protein CHU95_21430 [Niveispirillum lacus]|uniref:Uncharacterized protein n=1 Tax=Niveispirillum lacus TaxID=1981099 RepID=A0A255YTE0_9PROT|nr:DUF6702 family protein [Niveispirillum lacus]OYQ31700.1 hypothetical protein CHU95_21430 [Niveispirillum lacus]